MIDDHRKLTFKRVQRLAIAKRLQVRLVVIVHVGLMIVGVVLVVVVMVVVVVVAVSVVVAGGQLAAEARLGRAACDSDPRRGARVRARACSSAHRRLGRRARQRFAVRSDTDHGKRVA